MAEAGEHPRRRTFGPVVLLGLASAGLAAVAGSKPWLEVEPPGGECPAVPGVDYAALELSSPLAAALSLVVLAAWGVVLVTRGRFRRVVAALAVVASVGYLVTAIEAYSSLKQAALREAVEAGTAPWRDCPAASIWMNNTWWPAALVAGVLCVAASVAAVILVPSWPEMGTRYDAPAGARTPGQARPADTPETNIDIWKAIDEGRDPTA